MIGAKKKLYFRYVLFTLIYYVAGGKGKDGEDYIYKVLDWSKAGTAAGVSVGAILAVGVLHLVNYGLASWRQHCAGSRGNRRNLVTPMA